MYDPITETNAGGVAVAQSLPEHYYRVCRSCGALCSAFRKPPEQLGPEHVRRYLLYLLNEKKDTPNTIQVYRGALKFLYLQVLKQSWFDEEIAAPKQRLRLPTILRPDEIARILDRTINRKHWMILATFYATALRCCELRRLKIDDIDSRQMIAHVLDPDKVDRIREVAHTGQFIGTDKPRTVERKQLELFERMPPSREQKADDVFATKPRTA